MKQQVGYIFFIAFILSCQPTVVKQNIEPIQFFDLDKYFKTEILMLQDNITSIRKRVILNDSIEVMVLDSFDLNEELSIFIKSNINKSAWADKYTVDTIYEGTKVKNVIYNASDKALKTKKINLSFNDEATISEINIVNLVKNTIYTSEQQLQYIPQVFYKIENEQEVILDKRNRLGVEGIFLK